MQKGTLQDQVYDDILEGIMDGKFKMEDILNEKELSERYHVSKTPVREALLRLCNERILENLPRYGYRIVPVTQAEVNDIIEYRVLVEVEALRLGYQNITEKDIAELRRLDAISKEEMSKKESPYLAWRGNENFHWKLCEFCPNQYLKKSIKEALDICARYASQYFANVWTTNLPVDQSHEQILEALDRQDLEDAQRILAGDIELTLQEDFLNTSMHNRMADG